MRIKKEVLIIFVLLILSQIAYSAVVTQTGDTLDDPYIGDTSTISIIEIEGSDGVVIKNDEFRGTAIVQDSSTLANTPAESLAKSFEQGKPIAITSEDSTIDVNFETGDVYVEPTDKSKPPLDITGAAISNMKKAVNPIDGSITVTFNAQTQDGKIYEMTQKSGAEGSYGLADSTDYKEVERVAIEGQTPTETSFTTTTYPSYSQERIKFNFCGDSYLAFPEQCETPNTENNVYCVHSLTTQCVGTKTATRDTLGRCNDVCACSADNFGTAACVKNSCGASCGSGTDCPSGVCDQNTCSCVASTCIEDWVCTQYPSTCPSNGIKTRTCTDRNGCGTTTNKPAESINCIPQTTTPCNELWQCSEWSPSPCPQSGQQSRTCTDTNK